MKPVADNLWRESTDDRCYKTTLIRTRKIELLARFRTGARFDKQILAGPKNTIAAVDLTGRLWVIDSKGKLIGKSEETGPGKQPLMLADGSVAVPTERNGVFVFNPDASLRTRIDAASRSQGSLVSTNGQLIAIATPATESSRAQLRLIDADGDVKTSVELNSDPQSTPVFYGDDGVAIMTEKGIIFTYSLGGESRDGIKTGKKRGEPLELLTVGPQGEFVVASGWYPPTLRIFSRNGEKIGDIELPSRIEAPPAFFPGGRLAVTFDSFESSILLVDQNGDNAVRYDMGGRGYAISGTPLIGKDKTHAIVIGKRGRAHFIPERGEESRSFILGSPAVSDRRPILMSVGDHDLAVVIWEDGSVYFLNSDASLFGKYDLLGKRGQRTYIWASAAALEDERLAIVTDDGDILVLKPNLERPAKSLVWEETKCSPYSDGYAGKPNGKKKRRPAAQ